MSNVRWKVWTDATTPEKARRVLARVLRAIEATAPAGRIEPFDEGGHVAHFEIDVSLARWSDTVVEVLRRAQKLGAAWELRGDVDSALSLWATQTGVAGVTAVSIACEIGP